MRNLILKHKLGAVIVTVLISIITLTFIFIFRDELKEFGTLLTLIASAPVVFVIWVIRNENATQQIENTHKNTNLKEFQKLAEWVSVHLVEDKIIEKSINQNDNIETIREYTDIPQSLSIPTYSKKDGTVELQISAVYNLLPFYRGEHGESFKKPALNLLISAWLSLQQKELEKLEKLEKEKLIYNIDDNYKKVIDKIQLNAKSPLGIAITRVLLSLNSQQELCLLEHKEVFPNLVLAGMDFHLSGLDKKVLALFQTKFDYSGINLIAANLEEIKLQGSDLYKANLQGAGLYRANLQRSGITNTKLQGGFLIEAELQGSFLVEANLQGACLQGAYLQGAYFQGADLQGACLQGTYLQGAFLIETDLQGADFQGAYLQGAYLIEINLQGADFQGAYLQEAKFHNSNLEGTNFTNAEHLETVDFTGAQNLDKAIGLPPEIVEKFKQKTEN